MKLHQVLAILTGRKTKVQEQVTSRLHVAKKPKLFEGFTKEYRPLSDEESLPAERKNIPTTCTEIVGEARAMWSDLFDLVATLDHGNQLATAPVIVGNTRLLSDVPVTTLIFLEKRLEDVRTLLIALPVLPPEKNWKWSDATNCYVADEELVRKTGKVRKSHILYEATDNHPAQVEPYTVDETIGWWHTKHQSGALPAKEKAEMLKRADALIDAVKSAQKDANDLSVEKRQIAEVLFDYLLKGATPTKADTAK